MQIKELSTGCGDLLLTGFYPSKPNGGYEMDEKGYPLYTDAAASSKWLNDFLKAGKQTWGYTWEGRAFVIAILNEHQEKTFGHIFSQNGFEIISEGVNGVHDSVLTLRARVRRTPRLEKWAVEKQGRFAKWFEIIKDVVTPKKIEKAKDASGGTGKVLQRKVAVSASE
jgi:hypothetical protein